MKKSVVRGERRTGASSGAKSASSCESIGSAELLACMPYARRLLAGRNRRLGAPLGPNDVEDLAQEVFLRVWRGRALFRREASLEAWVGRFCLLTFIDELRRRRMCTAASFEREEPCIGGPINVEERIDLRRGDFILPELEARVVVLRLQGGLTFVEAANRMRCSPTAAKVAYRRGIESLRYRVSSDRSARTLRDQSVMRIVLRQDGALKLEPGRVPQLPLRAERERCLVPDGSAPESGQHP